MSGVRRALKEARGAVAMMVERGDYGAAIEALAVTVDKAFSRLGEALVKSMRELRENIDKLTADVEELRRSLELEVHMRRSDVGALRGEVVELRVIRGLADWFVRYAPEYEVRGWPMKRGPDLIIEGKGVLAAVEAAVRPKMEDVDQLIAGAGVVKMECGRKPDLLVVYSYSGEVPGKVAKYAAEKGVKIARGPRELKELLDGVASGR